MKEEHIQALLLYTNHSKYSKAFSETFRAEFVCETVGEIAGRNSHFYWTSRYLRELITCFGTESKRENKAFFTGVSPVLHVPQFQIGLNGPTSTSTARVVAERFAGKNGMIIKLKGGAASCFNAKPFSTYKEEEERIFFGSIKRMEVQSIQLMESTRKYATAMRAYSKFDALFNGDKAYSLRNLKTSMSELDIEIIKVL